MFAFISGGYHPFDKFFIYYCDDVTVDYKLNTVEMTLGTFACKRLHKIYVKTKNGVVTCDKKRSYIYTCVNVCIINKIASV